LPGRTETENVVSFSLDAIRYAGDLDVGRRGGNYKGRSYAGPHAQILEAVKPIAAKKGLDIQLVEFSDYVVPNAALDAGDIQANSFQNQPYLDNQGVCPDQIQGGRAAELVMQHMNKFALVFLLSSPF
jgi:hypothetical protein